MIYILFCRAWVVFLIGVPNYFALAINATYGEKHHDSDHKHHDYKKKKHDSFLGDLFDF